MTQKTFYLADEQQTEQFAASVAKSCEQQLLIYLAGELGAGKTTFCRGFLQGLGHQGKVKSPTYTIVEPYQLANKQVFHFDLYRIGDIEELELIGIRDYFAREAIILLEWPERGADILPPADLNCYIEPLAKGRQMIMESQSKTGDKILAALQWNHKKNHIS